MVWKWRGDIVSIYCVYRYYCIAIMSYVDMIHNLIFLILLANNSYLVKITLYVSFSCNYNREYVNFKTKIILITDFSSYDSHLSPYSLVYTLDEYRYQFLFYYQYLSTFQYSVKCHRGFSGSWCVNFLEKPLTRHEAILKLWILKPRSLVRVYWRFGVPYRFQLQVTLI